MVPGIYAGGSDAESPRPRDAAPGDAWRRRFTEVLPAAVMADVARAEETLRRLPPGTRLLWPVQSYAGVRPLLGALCAGLTVVPLPPGERLDDAIVRFDADAVLGEDGAIAFLDQRGRLPRVPMARLLLRTSATGGLGTWVALSDENLFAVLDSHLPHLGLEGRTACSVLPWSHAFGLVLDLLANVLGGATFVRAPDAARDPVELARVILDEGCTHLSAVPLVLERLRRSPRPEVLARLEGGIVGGAPLSAPLADWLVGSRLRVGYGQTEASPGITLGEPGEFRAGLLGRPVGCEVRLDWEGVLLFRGPNACIGTWGAHGLHPLPADRWVWTGDYARHVGDVYLFDGRATPMFKLANARPVAAGTIERELRRLHGVREALVWTPDGETIAVGISPPSALPAEFAVRRVLGSLGALPLRLVPVEEDEWPRTPKGDLDRRHPPPI